MVDEEILYYAGGFYCAHHSRSARMLRVPGRYTYSIVPRAYETLQLTDSSSLHWGGHVERTLGVTRVHRFQGTPDISLQARGSWTPQEAAHHINWKELMAVYRCLLAFQSSVLHQNIRVQSDNKTTVALINRQGTVHSRLLHFATHKLLNWCHYRGIWLL